MLHVFTSNLCEASYVPIVGGVYRKAIVARFSSTLESLLGSGVEIIDALEIVKRIIDNTHVSQVIDQAIDDINKGRSMANALSAAKWFQPMFVQMIAIGESSGHLEEMLAKERVEWGSFARAVESVSASDSRKLRAASRTSPTAWAGVVQLMRLSSTTAQVT